MVCVCVRVLVCVRVCVCVCVCVTAIWSNSQKSANTDSFTSTKVQILAGLWLAGVPPYVLPSLLFLLLSLLALLVQILTELRLAGVPPYVLTLLLSLRESLLTYADVC
jgi:hypothetical protein